MQMIIIENECFSVPQICESGQCFRLDPVSEDTYKLIAKDRYLKIQIQKVQNDEKGKEKRPGSVGERTILFCTEEEYREFWEEYFDLGVRYEDYLAAVAPDDEYLQAAAGFGRGIRILRQDLWEMIITFILSQQNNIPRIKGLIRAICERYGQKRTAADGTVYDAFPDAQSLAAATEEELRALKLGYRSRYICGTAAMIADGKLDLEQIGKMEYQKAKEELMRLPGIGGKVADCICLFALHQMDAFPVDTHIKKVLDARYAGRFPFERYRGCAGVMQQYIFYYDLYGDA